LSASFIVVSALPQRAPANPRRAKGGGPCPASFRRVDDTRKASESTPYALETAVLYRLRRDEPFESSSGFVTELSRAQRLEAESASLGELRAIPVAEPVATICKWAKDHPDVVRQLETQRTRRRDARSA
jgi:hypothetical protein